MSTTASILRLVLASASLSAALAAVGLQERPPVPPASPPQPRPTFRSGVDLVALDVIVLDKDRRPVKGLGADDFTITEDDAPQPIETFEQIDVPEPEADAPGWMREVARDVVSNDIQTRRLVLLVLDDANMDVEHGEPKSVRAIAYRVIDGLGPSDLAAVVCTFLGRVESFTSDRRKLRAAVEAFAPHGRNLGRAGPPLGCMLRPGGCAVDTISRVADVLRAAPGGRKLLVFISPQLGTGAEIAARPDEFDGLDAIRTMFANLQLANVSVYTYDPRGIMPSGYKSSNEIALAEATGGRRVQGTNSPEGEVRQMFRESSAYYLIGYRTTHLRPDGRFRRIRVNVNRSGVEVRTRTGYFAPGAASDKETAKRTVPQQLDLAIRQGFPVSDVGVRATIAAFAARGANKNKTAELVAVLALREPATLGSALPTAAAPRKRVEIVAAAFDMEGRPKGSYRQTLELTLRSGVQPGSEYEVASRLPLAPGRYELRIATTVDGRAGSVFTTIEVPDFAKDPLSLSGVVVETQPPPYAAAQSMLADLLPVVPTAVRSFGAGATARAFVRVYQGGSRAPAPVVMTVRVTDVQQAVRVTSTSRLPAEAFVQTRAADFTWLLPTPELGPGEYLLTLEAVLGERRAIQHVRFHVAE
jgi:VWFA-related protein